MHETILLFPDGYHEVFGNVLEAVGDNQDTDEYQYGTGGDFDDVVEPFNAVEYAECCIDEQCC